MRQAWGVGTRILTVEDDERIRTAVKLALEDEGWDVDEAENGEDALERLQRASPADVVLIDIMLPGHRRLRGVPVDPPGRATCPIVMVTARADTHDVVAGLEAGADDYLTKPFAPKELSARIRALLRRARTSDSRRRPPPVRRPRDRPRRGRGARWRARPSTSPRPSSACSSSWRRTPGEVFSREVLLDRIWGYGYFGDGRLVDVHVRRLRTKVEPDPANPRHVVTVRGLGYKLAP